MSPESFLTARGPEDYAMKVALLMALAVSLTTLEAEVCACGPTPQTLNGWNDYVAATEARIHRELTSRDGFLLTDFSDERLLTRKAISRGEIPIAKIAVHGDAARVMPGGTIAHWRGAVLLRSITLDSLLQRLQHPDENGPQQQDVIWMRVRERQPTHLTVVMRLTRKAVVTVTYDTEHTVSYRRLGTNRAASSSVSTRIVEIADAGTPSERALASGDDRGLLWRMNSYWRFEEVADGVIVELESVTLSRHIPFGLARVVAPIIDRIAHESVGRTLAGLRALHTRDPEAAAAQ